MTYLTVILPQSVQHVSNCITQLNSNSIEIIIRFSDDFSIFCHHQYSIFQMHMTKLQWGDFISLPHCPCHRKAQMSTVCESQIDSPHTTRIWFSCENYISHIRASGRSWKKVKFRGNCSSICGNNGWFRGNFWGQFLWRTIIGKEQPISWELPEQISLESDWFCADLRKVFNETWHSYSIYLGFILQYEIHTLQVSLLNVIKTSKRIWILKTHLLF